VQHTCVNAGLTSPHVIPSPKQLRSRRHSDVPYRGLIFVSDSVFQGDVTTEDDIITKLEEHREIIRGVIYEADNLLIEFEGLHLDDGSGSVTEAITQLNKLAFREMRFAGQASMLLSEAKSYLPGERGREALHQHYSDTGDLGFPEQSDFIEAKVYFSNYHRDLLNEVPGIVDFVGGDQPLSKRGSVLKPAELKPVKISGEVVAQFAPHRYQLYVVQTQSQSEKGVVDTLLLKRAEDEDALLLGDKSRMFINQTRFISQNDDGTGISKKKFGYIYVSVHLDSTSWHLIKSIPKVSGFVGGKNINEVRPLSSIEAQTIFGMNEQRNEREEVVTQKFDYVIGDIVEVTEGPFARYKGQVQEVSPSQETMRILIDTTGTSLGVSGVKDQSGFSSGLNIPIEVEISQVKKFG
jgi:transcriptional antiterminator NusG